MSAVVHGSAPRPLSAPPVFLSEADLAEELAHIHQHKRRTWTTAVQATGIEGTVTAVIGAEQIVFEAISVACEIDLRRALVRAPTSARPLLLLVRYTAGQLPPDVSARVAGGKVHSIDRARRLQRLLRAISLSADLLQCRPLADVLLSLGQPVAKEQAVAVATRAFAFRHLLRVLLDLPPFEPSPGVLLAHLLGRPVSAEVASVLQTPGLASPLDTYLDEQVGVPARSILESWLKGKLDQLLAVAFLLDALRTRGVDHPAVRATLLPLIAAAAPASTHGLLDGTDRRWLRWADLATEVARRLADGAAPRLGEILRRSEALVLEPTVVAMLADSLFLPAGLSAHQAALAELFEQSAAPAVSATSLRALTVAARERLSRMENHRDVERDAPLRDRLRMATRLVAYLAHRAEETAKGPEHWSRVAVRYAAEGGFVDRARAEARGSDDTRLTAAIQLVVAQVDSLCDSEDRAFAQGYAEHRRHHGSQVGVVPIADALRTYLRPTLASPDRRVLVLLLDGMSWANAVELFEDMEESLGAGPAALHFEQGFDRHAVVAALPTLTHVSRAAFFAGKEPAAGDSPNTAKDPARFRDHKLFAELGIAPPTLLLRDTAETPSGELSPAAVQLIAGKERVVGLVVNALDDQLSGAKQMRVRAQVATIKPLRRIFDEAAAAQRVVLIAADHGHVRTDRMSSTGKTGEGRRWRLLEEKDVVLPGEVELKPQAGWLPQGTTRGAALWDTRLGHGMGYTPGEHGGASLAEVLVPMVLLSPSARGVGDDSKEMIPRAFPRPAFWSMEPPLERKRTAQTAAGAAPSPPKAPPPPQLVLPTIAPAVPHPPAAPTRDAKAPPQLPALFQRLRGLSPAGKLLDQYAEALSALSDAKDGKLSVDVFAQHAKVHPRNVGGVIDELQGVVNLDGYTILVLDRAAKLVRYNEDYLKEALSDE